MKIPFNQVTSTSRELRYVARAVKSGILAGDGPFTKRCAAWLEKNLQCPKALLTHSGTAALEMAAILADIQPGDEVIMPSFTFVSTAGSVVLRGGIPVFVDIRPDTLNLDESLVDRAVTRKTRAIVPVHYAGIGCDMDALMAIADRRNLVVIEDAAQALLSRFRKKPLGSIGHFGCISFHETKNIVSGEGGALLINDPRFIERAQTIREKGTNRAHFLQGKVEKYSWVDLGSSFLPGELTAAYLLAQLERAGRITAARTRLFRRYMDLLQPLEKSGRLRLPRFGKEVSPNGSLFYILLNSRNDRNRLIEFLRKKGIASAFHYVPLHSSPFGSRAGRVSGGMKNTEDLSDRLLRLPLFYGMSVPILETVVDSVTAFFAEKR